jgi:hypothetical protein
MYSIGDIIKTGFPDASDSDMDYIMWSRTSYPFELIEAKDIYKEASRVYRAKQKGNRLCDFCNAIARNNGTCSKCNALMHRDN